MPRRLLGLAFAVVLGCAGLAACGTGEPAGQITLAYQRSTDQQNRVIDAFLQQVADQYAKDHPGKKVRLIPIQASENDYYTKISLMMRSKRTSPDIVYEDTFRIAADEAAGYLTSLDGRVAAWPDWKHIESHPRTAVQVDGKIYGIPNNTDTRALWYNKRLFRKAGLPVPWHPKSWNDLLSAARAIKKRLPGVIPLNVYTGQGGGEQSSMQGFEMLLYGTRDRLYDENKQQWIVGSPGFKDSLKFIRTVYTEDLGPKPSDALDPNISTNVTTAWLPQNKLAIDLDGSWINSQWQEGGPAPWADWSKVMGVTTMPPQHASSNDVVTLAGGWAWSIPANAHHPDLAFDLIKTLSSEKNMRTFNLATQNITVRDDVARDRKYLSSAPTTKFFTDLLAQTQYRPKAADYPQISTAIQDAMGTVTTGGEVTEAAQSYDSAVREAVNDDSAVRSVARGR